MSASHPEAPGTSAASNRRLLQGRLPDRTDTTPTHPHDWTTPDVVNWLEGLGWVPQMGIEYITSLDGDGEFMTTLVECTGHCEAVLTKEFGIESAGHRLLLISRLRKLCRVTARGAKDADVPFSLLAADATLRVSAGPVHRCRAAGGLRGPLTH